MPQASILWDGNPSPYDALDIGVSVTISNDDIGGEVTYDYQLIKRPVNSTAVLVGSGASRTLTPDVVGTYIVRLIVNGSAALTDIGAGAVLYFPSNLREPAVEETFEWNSTEGWAETFKQIWERANHGYGVKPAASASVWGRIWHEAGAPTIADTFEVCLKNASDVYEWINLLGGSGGLWDDNAGLNIYPKDGGTVNVAIGATAMSGVEKFRVVGYSLFEGNVSIEDAGTLDVEGDIYTQGNIDADGDITADGDVTITGASSYLVLSGGWNTSHIQMGTYHLWIDSSGRLRIKNGVPASDTDGVVVGQQS